MRGPPGFGEFVESRRSRPSSTIDSRQSPTDGTKGAISDPEHVTAAAALRRGHMTVEHRHGDTEVQIRALGDHATALGIDDYDGTVAW